jgi:hypothetical protein
MNNTIFFMSATKDLDPNDQGQPKGCQLLVLMGLTTVPSLNNIGQTVLELSSTEDFCGMVKRP